MIMIGYILNNQDSSDYARIRLFLNKRLKEALATIVTNKIICFGNW